jgi:hypothetical protein
LEQVQKEVDRLSNKVTTLNLTLSVAVGIVHDQELLWSYGAGTR